MLQSIREKTSGWIATVILGMFAVGMLFFGIQGYITPKVETFAAKVESAPSFWIFGKKTREVSVDDFHRRFEQVRQLYTSDYHEIDVAGRPVLPSGDRTIDERNKDLRLPRRRCRGW